MSLLKKDLGFYLGLSSTVTAIEFIPRKVGQKEEGVKIIYKNEYWNQYLNNHT